MDRGIGRAKKAAAKITNSGDGMVARWTKKQSEAPKGDTVICLLLFGREFAITGSDTAKYDNPAGLKIEEFVEQTGYQRVDDRLTLVEYAALAAAFSYRMESE